MLNSFNYNEANVVEVSASLNSKFWTKEQAESYKDICDTWEHIKSQATVSPEQFDELFPKVKNLTTANKDVKAAIKIAEEGLGRELTLVEKHNTRNAIRLEKMAELTSASKDELVSLLKKEQDVLKLGAKVEIELEPKPEDAPKSKKQANVVYIDRTGDPNKKIGLFQKAKIDSKGQLFILIVDLGKQFTGEALAASSTEYSFSMLPVSRIKSFRIDVDGVMVDVE